MFTNKNHTLFYLWWKESLVINKKIFNYHDHGCLQNVLLLFISLLTAPIVKNSHILAETYFNFAKKKKNVPDVTRKSFKSKFRLHWKGHKSNYQVRPTLAPFCRLVSLTLHYASNLKVNKIVKQIKSEGAWDEFEAKKSL